MRDDISPEQSEREQQLTETVIRSFEHASDRRLREILQSLTGHLHAFIRDTRLTEEEWNAGISFLTDVGHTTTDWRQEFVLLSDVLGASMQVIGVNNAASGDATEATVFGPFFVNDAPLIDQGGDMAFGAAGEPCWVTGSVTDTSGRPLPGARIEVWEADDEGLYDVQYDDGRTAARAHLFADGAGQYRFWGLTPTPYPIPDDGPVGRMLRAVGRSPMRASHLHFMVTVPGHRRVVTHIFVRGDEIGWKDTVFGVKESLVKDFIHHDSSDMTPDGRDVGQRGWSEVRFDIVLAPSDTVFTDRP